MPRFILFEVAKTPYALPAEQVEQVLRMVAVTPVAGGPHLMAGVVNVRGAILPVLCFRRWRGLPPKTPLPEHHLLLINVDGTRAALHVDGVTGIEDVPPESFEPSGAWTPGSGSVAGALKLEKGIVLVHDLVPLIASVAAGALDEARPGPP